MCSKPKNKSRKLAEELEISESMDAVLRNKQGEVIDARHTDNIKLRSIPNLEIEISSSQSDDLSLLYRLLKNAQKNK